MRSILLARKRDNNKNNNIMKLKRLLVLFPVLFFLVPGMVAHAEDLPGALNGIFSTSATTTVRFSKGNLQCQPLHESWSFASHQWEVIGASNSTLDDYNTNQYDLFGWGTSGYRNAADPYCVNYMPWSTSNTIGNSGLNVYGYGPSSNMADTNLTGTSAQYDWGVHNAITNGGNVPGMWRTPTMEEWTYLFNTRAASTLNGTANARYCKATVNGVCGVILFPDTYSHPSGVAVPTAINTGTASFSANSYSASDWELLEAAGCVLLPTTGYRDGTEVSQVNTEGYYQSSTKGWVFLVSVLAFDGDGLSTTHAGVNNNGYAVRLVHDLPSTPRVSPLKLEQITSSTVFYTYGVTAGSGVATASGVCWSTSPHPTVGGSHDESGHNDGVFQSSLVLLEPSTTYYVRAYATSGGSTVYGPETKFSTRAADGALRGVFSVSENRLVKFSQGNLQYKATTETWRFADNQYDYVGGWIDNESRIGNLQWDNSEIAANYSG